MKVSIGNRSCQDQCSKYFFLIRKVRPALNLAQSGQSVVERTLLSGNCGKFADETKRRLLRTSKLEDSSCQISSRDREEKVFSL